MLQKAAAEVVVPRHIKADLDANPQYAKSFFTSVGQAVRGSVEDTETGISLVTKSLLEERIQMCYDLIVTMRRDGERSFKECFGSLSTMLREMIVDRRHRDDIVEQRTKSNIAPLDGQTTTQVPDDQDDLDSIKQS